MHNGWTMGCKIIGMALGLCFFGSLAEAQHVQVDVNNRPADAALANAIRQCVEMPSSAATISFVVRTRNGRVSSVSRPKGGAGPVASCIHRTLRTQRFARMSGMQRITIWIRETMPEPASCML